MNIKNNFLLPITIALFTALGMFIGIKFKPPINASGKLGNNQQKIQEILKQVERNYVDTPDIEMLTEEAVKHVLSTLDPYSSYIAAKDLEKANEPLEGNFQGIGVEFSIIKDTLTVVSPIAGGPSEKLGIKAGDKIITIEGEDFYGKSLNNTMVVNTLRGKKNTTVTIGIKRKGVPQLLDYTITRDEIPIYSVDAHYIIADSIGYIKVSRFAATTMQEFNTALLELQKEGLNSLILDLRGNPGGYLETAKQMANVFLDKGDLIVYTEGRERDKEVYRADGKGLFKKEALAILIDEGSASASEIVSGAIQDHDRGIIVGRRSHGKGLVQEPMSLSDGSAIRLTVARYYTPSGRCIQRPYDETAYGLKELVPSQKSIDHTDTSTYQTDNGRAVKGGGGILPDIIVAEDTAHFSAYLSQLIRFGILNEFTSNFADNKRLILEEKYPAINSFESNFKVDKKMLDALVEFANNKGIAPNSVQLELSKDLLSNYIKALTARHIYGDIAYYKVINSQNLIVQRAIIALSKKEELSLLGLINNN